MTLFKNTLLILTTILVSCSSGKNPDEKTAAKVNKEKVEIQKLMDEGFTKGVIVASTVEGECPYTIQADNNDAYRLDPINLEEKYKKNGEKIWVKYTPLRMKNRCDNANPVTVVKIMKREE